MSNLKTPFLKLCTGNRRTSVALVRLVNFRVQALDL